MTGNVIVGGRAVRMLSLGLLISIGCSAAAPAGGGRQGSTAGSGPEPVAIAGGYFEASGVAHVPGTNQLLLVDDNRHRELLLMRLGADGRQMGTAVRVPLPADVTDLEGMTADGHFFYAVGSQSKLTGFEGDGLIRFVFDTVTGRITSVDRVPDLKGWLARHVPELRGTERQLGEHILNIEGLAWDPVRRRLLLGLRAPVVRGAALIVPVTLTDTAGPFVRENLRVDGPTLRVRLGGAGIRSIEYDHRLRAFWLITGSDLNEEKLQFRIVEWDGESATPGREISAYSRFLKPEGVTRASIDGRDLTVIVFDTGRFAILQ